MAILTKTEGYFIINGGAISLSDDTEVSHRDDAVVQEFDSEAEMLTAHKDQFPEHYEVETLDEIEEDEPTT